MVGGLADAAGVLGTALRLLARHAPVLLAVFLASVIAHELIMRAAVRASLLNAELGFLVLLLAPMTTLSALVIMLRVVRPSLPWLGSGADGPPPSALEHLGSVLVPFMTIYYFEDDLYADIRSYAGRIVDDATERDLANIGENGAAGGDAASASAPDRLPYDLSLTLAAVVVGAIAARWLLSRWQATQRHRWLGIPGAYLELVWLTLVLVVAFRAVADLIIEWGGNRRLVHAIHTGWNEVVGGVSGAGASPDRAADWFVGQLGQIDTALVIPISWLAVGVVVLGSRLPPGPGAGSGRTVRERLLYEQARQRWLAAPRALRWVLEQVTDDLRTRFLPLVHGTRMLLRAGVVPMLLFCLAFVAAQTVADWLWELQRLLIGPQDTDSVWIPLAWPLGELNRAVGNVVLVCLLAAAVDWALAATHRPGPPAGLDAPPPSQAPPPPGPGAPVPDPGTPPPSQAPPPGQAPPREAGSPHPTPNRT